MKNIPGVNKNEKYDNYTVTFTYKYNRINTKNFKTINEAVYARYLLEIKINPKRFIKNDEMILQYIAELNDQEKINIEKYIDKRIAEYGEIKPIKINRYKVYKYTSPSNKVYIGQTCKTLRQRAKSDGSGYMHCSHFYNAIKKYGIDNFQCEILKSKLTLQEANYWECYYIKKYNSTDPQYGYNITDGGSQARKLSDEGKLKISNYMKKNNPMKNPEIAYKVSLQNKGRILSDEIREKMSISRKKKVECIETGIIYESRNEAAKDMGVAGSGIGRAINGEQETSAGYHWRYI